MRTRVLQALMLALAGLLLVAGCSDGPIVTTPGETDRAEAVFSAPQSSST